MSSPLLALAQVTPTPAAVQAAVDAYAFWLAVLDRLLPVLTPLAVALAAYLTWLTKRDLGRVESRLNGRLTEMVDAQAKAAHAEGKLEGLKEAPPAPVAPVVVVPPVSPPPRDPSARTRASDQTSAPPSVDPSSHQP